MVERSSTDGRAVRHGWRVAVVGATGAVGRTLLDVLEERRFPVSCLELVASARSAGGGLRCGGRRHVVRDLERFDFDAVDLAFFSAGTEVSRRWVPEAVARGATVVDNTNAFRMDAGVALVVPQVNGHALRAEERRPGIVAVPNCSTIPLARALAPVHRLAGLRRVVVATYQAASGGGRTGMRELLDGTRSVLAGREAPARRFRPPLAFDALPAIDRLMETGWTLEEQKMRQESRKILGLDGLDVSATCVRVPVLNGHSSAVDVETVAPVTRAQLAAVLGETPGVRLWDARHPTPRTIDDHDIVHVGRLRVDPEHDRRAAMWLVSDNLRVGAALTAVQIAELLWERSR